MILTTSSIYAELNPEYRFTQLSPFIDSPFRGNNIQDGLGVLVTIWGVNSNCNNTIIVSDAYQTQNQVLCKGDSSRIEEQQADPIASEEFEFVFPKSEIKIGDSVDVCVRLEIGFSNCKTLDVKSEQLEKISFNLP